MTFETEREIQIHVANHMIGKSAQLFPLPVCVRACVFGCLPVASPAFLPLFAAVVCPGTISHSLHTGVRQTGEMNSSISGSADIALNSCSIV